MDASLHHTLVPMIDDSNQPIVHKKSVHGCTEHLIENYAAFEKLLPFYKAFVTNLDCVKALDIIQEVLMSPAWKNAVEEEIHALNENNKWTLTKLPPSKNLVGCK